MSDDDVDASYPGFTKEDLYRERSLIFKGTVVEKGASAYTNPDNTRTDRYGYQVENKLVTNYTVRIDELYKGEYEGQTITIKVSSTKEDPFALEVGTTYIFPLGKPIDAESEELEQFWGIIKDRYPCFIRNRTAHMKIIILSRLFIRPQSSKRLPTRWQLNKIRKSEGIAFGFFVHFLLSQK